MIDVISAREASDPKERKSKMKLSQRMEAVAAMVSAGNILADVGTDHGYIPIVLVSRGHIPSAIAMDLREGPLKRAREHIAASRLENSITTRLSDGVAALSPGEADTIVIAGMGGELVIRILRQGEAVCKSADELVLQPQSEVTAVRRFLRENGYRITDEDMVLEDGKFYPLMRAVCGEEAESCQKGADCAQFGAETNNDDKMICDIYGPLLLAKRHPVLKLFLEKQKKQLDQIRLKLEKQPQSDKIASRIEEVCRDLAYNEKALSYLKL